MQNEAPNKRMEPTIRSPQCKLPRTRQQHRGVSSLWLRPQVFHLLTCRSDLGAWFLWCFNAVSASSTCLRMLTRIFLPRNAARRCQLTTALLLRGFLVGFAAILVRGLCVSLWGLDLEEIYTGAILKFSTFVHKPPFCWFPLGVHLIQLQYLNHHGECYNACE